MIRGFALTMLLLASGPFAFERDRELQSAAFFLGVRFDRVGDVALVVVVPGSHSGVKKGALAYWLNLKTLESRGEDLDVSGATASGHFVLLGAAIMAEGTATVLCDAGEDRLLVTKSPAGPARVSRLSRSLGPAVLAVTEMRRTARGLVLLGSESDGPAIAEIDRQGTLLWKRKIAVDGDGVALDAFVSATGEMAVVGISGLSGPRPQPRSSWLARLTQDGQVESVREWRGLKPRIVPLKGGSDFALLYQEDGSDLLRFVKGVAEPPGAATTPLTLPQGDRCGSVGLGPAELLMMCNVGADSLILRATPTGVDEGTSLRATNRVRPPILFERDGVLFEISMALESNGASEKLLWRWGSLRK